MTAVAGSPGEFTLGSLNDATPWFPLFGLADDPGFNITGTFVGTITIQTSNQGDEIKTRVSALPTTYTTATGPRAMPRNASRWFRAVMTAYTSGTAYFGLTAPNSIDGVPASISGQMQGGQAVGDAF